MESEDKILLQNGAGGQEEEDKELGEVEGSAQEEGGQEECPLIGGQEECPLIGGHEECPLICYLLEFYS